MKLKNHSFLFAAAILASVASAIAAILYLIFGLTLGPTTVRNQFIPFWLNLLVFYHSCQAIYLLHKRLRFITNCYFYFDLIFFAACAIGSLLLVIFYSFARHKIDSVIFSVWLFVMCTTNALILVFRRKAYMCRVREAEIEKTNYKFVLDKEPPDFFEYLGDEETVESLAWKCRRVLNVIFKIVFLLILGLLVAGAWTIGTGYLWYPARGEFSIVKFNSTKNERELKIHWMCDGPRDNTKPVFLFDGSGSHVMADYYGLQIILAQQNRRSCIFDLPGQGILI